MHQITTAEGGTALAVSPLTELRRYLMMGTAATHYATAADQEVRFENVIKDALAATLNHIDVVNLIAECRDLAPKPEPSIKALALVISFTYADAPNVTDYAWTKLRHIVRNGSHMLTFAATLNKYRGWGRSVQRNIGQWYIQQGDNLGYDLTKYQGRTVDGARWEQKDVLALTFGKTKGGKLSGSPKFAKPSTDLFEILQWAHGDVDIRPEVDTVNANYVRAVQQLGNMAEPDLIQTIRDFGMPWEVVPSHRRTRSVWEALLPYMGSVAFFRNLGVMAAAGVAPLDLIVKLKTARAHPLIVLTAWYVYRQGHGNKGKLTWKPNTGVTTALEEAFYDSFTYVAPTGVPQLVALDVSSSMTFPSFNGIDGLTPRTVSAVLAMTTMRTETVKPDVVAFSTDLVDFDMSADDSLETVIRTMARTRFGLTRTSLPLRYMLEQNKDYAAYTVYTDVQTHDRDTPALLAKVRERTPLKMIEVSMAANAYTMTAEPMDLTIAGFSSDLPAMIGTFIKV